MKKINLLVVIVSNILIFIIWFNFNLLINRKNKLNSRINTITNDYNFINPLLDCDFNYNFISTKKLEKTIKEYLIKNNILNDFSIFFRILKNGSFFWINENNSFISASLTKIPIAIAYFKLSEEKWYEDLLEREVFIENIFNQSSRNIWQDTIQVWETYTILKLIEEMLINSDNTSASILFEYMPEYINTIYKDLWIKEIDLNSEEFILNSSKENSMFFRILYNSSYLKKENSEKLLQILSKSSFSLWIRADIPKTIKISNKFWEKWFFDSSEKQLHDCWIIYLPENPYVLCIMTTWYNFNELSKHIKYISNTIYDFMKNIKN